MIQLSVIVPAYNESRLIGGCLDSLDAAVAALGRERAEVIVVDNNSTDNTGEIARAHGAKVVFEPKNQIARARNAGAEAAAGSQFVFVDADTCVHPGILVRVAALLDSGTVVGGSAAMDFDGPWDLRLAVKAFNFALRLYPLAYGAFVFCEREAFERVGRFDEALYASEEVDFARALKRDGRSHGKRFVFIADCVNATSARKFRDFGRWGLLKTSLSMLWHLDRNRRSREACAKLWYDVRKE